MWLPSSIRRQGQCVEQSPSRPISESHLWSQAVRNCRRPWPVWCLSRQPPSGQAGAGTPGSSSPPRVRTGGASSFPTLGATQQRRGPLGQRRFHRRESHDCHSISKSAIDQPALTGGTVLRSPTITPSQYTYVILQPLEELRPMALNLNVITLHTKSLQCFDGPELVHR